MRKPFDLNDKFVPDGVRNFQDMYDSLQTRKDPTSGIIRYMQRRESVEVSTEQFFSDLHRAVSILLSKGMQGRHIALCARNCYEWVVCYSAILYIGSVAVLLNKDLNAAEIKEYMHNTDSDVLLYDTGLVAPADESIYAQKMPTSFFYEWNAADEIISDFRSTAGLDDLCCIIFTSGTTGKSKAVMLSNRALIVDFSVYLFPEPTECALSIMPFHHLAGFSVAFNALFCGTIMAIGEDPSQIIKALEKTKAEYVLVVPALLNLIVQRLSKKTQEELGWSLKYLACGGAKFQSGVLETLWNAGIEVYQIYSASESGGTGLLMRMIPENRNSIGKPYPCADVSVINGEIVMSGPTLMMGYYRDPEGTAEVIRDGWYHTGDCGYIQDGYFYLNGRIKNLIILSNGENISPEELEGTLLGNSEISEVLVFEERDFLAAEIFPNYPEAGSADERQQMRSRLESYVKMLNQQWPTYKNIRFVHFRDTPFPKNSTGKIIRSIH